MCGCTAFARNDDSALSVPPRSVPAPPLSTAPPPPTPTPAPRAAPELPVDSPPEAAPEQAAHPPAAEAKRPAPVVVELPYKLYERPRAEGAVFAAGQDEELARWNVGGTADPNYVSNRPGYHPGARVVVDVAVVGGRLPQRSRQGMSQARLLAQARSKGYWPIRICFEDALRRDAKQHGKTLVRVRIARSSRVLDTRLLDSELDELAAQCLREVLGKLQFSPQMPGTVTADISIKLWPGDAPVPVNDAPPGVTVNNPGLLDRKGAQRVLLNDIALLEECYRAGLERDPELWGRVQLRIEFDEKGRLETIDENESSFPDADVTRCIIGAVRGLGLPTPRDGLVVYNQGIRLGSPKFDSDESATKAQSSDEKPAQPPGASVVSD